MTSTWVLGAFACLLVLVGAMGFLPRSEHGVASNAPAYNVFHLCFGALGLALAVWGNETGVRTFLIGFGLIDLYQALASRQHWFPAAHFRWKPADDVLHVVIGFGLVAAGALL